MKTALYSEHVRNNAKVVSFAGWDMPLFYEGILQEVELVRKKAGVFDVSHMGKIHISGKDTLHFLDYISARSIQGKAFGKAFYTVMCNTTGGTLDDLLVYLISPKEAFIIVNASCRTKDLSHLQEVSSHFEVQVEDAFTSHGILSLQGPTSPIQKLYPDLHLKPFEFVEKEGMIISRTGYTGEEGYEFYGDNTLIKVLWDNLMDLKVAPIGLGARDILRLEMGYALYGHELSESISPLESVAFWTVDLENHSFIGKNALQNTKTAIALIGEKIPAREGYPLFYHQKPIGVVTSGTFSPTLQRPIALGLLDTHVDENTELEVLIRGVYYPFKVTTLPFIHRS